MMLIEECVAFLENNGFSLRAVESYDGGSERYFSRDGLMVVLQESLLYGLDGKVNEIKLSAKMKGSYSGLKEFQSQHLLAGGFIPHQGAHVNDVVEWNMMILQNVNVGLSLFKSGIEKALTYAQKNQTIEVHSRLHRCSREWSV